MEIIYRAFDGKEFCNPEECIKHENGETDFVMFDKYGKPVTDINDCHLVFVRNCTDEVEEKFEDFCFSGRYDICEGWFYFDDNTDELVEITDLVELIEEKMQISIEKILKTKK